MSDLKPCPCCGAKAEEVNQCVVGNHIWWIACTECAMRTDFQEVIAWSDEVNLYKTWNNRTLEDK